MGAEHTPDELRARNRAYQARWRRDNPDRARQLQIAKPSYDAHVAGEDLGLGRPMTRAEVGQLAWRRSRGRAAEPLGW